MSSQCRRFVCRSEEHTSELQSRPHLVCRLLLEKKNFEIGIFLLNSTHSSIGLIVMWFVVAIAFSFRFTIFTLSFSKDGTWFMPGVDRIDIGNGGVVVVIMVFVVIFF